MPILSLADLTQMQPIVLTNAFLRPRATRGSSGVSVSENTNVFACVEEVVTTIREEIGATPIFLPTSFDPESIEDFLYNVDGILLPGAVSNIHPSKYGQGVHEMHQVFDLDHDATDIFLVKKAYEMNIPFLGICRSMQAMNVAFGGTLTQKLSARNGIDHSCSNPCDGHSDDPQYMHPALIPSGTHLAHLFPENQISVNSMHEQAVDNLGLGLNIEARSPDGVVEAISHRDTNNFLMGVQWHPEALPKHNVSQVLFKAFRVNILKRFENRIYKHPAVISSPQALHNVVGREI